MRTKLFMYFVGLSALFTQLSMAQGFYLGPKAGLNLAKVTEIHEKSHSLTGFNAGLMAEYRFGDIVAIQPELNFSQQGFKFDYSFVTKTTEKVTERINYISLPLMAKLYLYEGLNLKIGPRFSYLVHAKRSSEDVKHLYNKFDIGATMGIAYDFALGLTVDARYTPSFMDLRKDKKTELKTVDVTSNNSKNTMFQFSLGYKFKLN